MPTILTVVGEQNTSYTEVAESPGDMGKVVNEYPSVIGVLDILFSIANDKQIKVVGLGVGVAAVDVGTGVAVAAVEVGTGVAVAAVEEGTGVVVAVEVGAGVAVAATVAVGTGVPVAVALGTGVGGGATIFLPAAATQLPVVGRVTGVQVVPLSLEV